MVSGSGAAITFMKLRVVAALSVVAAQLLAATPLPDRIVVSSNHHFFADRAGAPFFWLGDMPGCSSASSIAMKLSATSMTVPARGSTSSR